MASAGANIEALLSLDVSNFEKGITKAIETVESLETSIKSIDTSSKSFTKLGETAEKSSADMSKLETTIKNIEASLSALGGSVSKIGTSFEKYTGPVIEKQIMKYKQLINEINSMQIAPTMNSLSNFSYLGENLDSIHNKMNNVSNTSKNTSSSLKGLSSTTNEVSSSINKTSESFNKSATSAKNATTTYNQMGKALSSLKMIGSTVASLFAYDVVLSLAQSIRGTIQQKSEMESFQKTMRMTSSQISSFNNALDQTISKYGKISKYNLGETVASLGVEFDLTNKQMQQAMDITAMLQSEYVRAGRTADEATLAVKDIMQGEFVRLSRETGVGKGELMAAGWSGDNTDIATLMDALEKVAKSRHWDIFAAKATSLSDVLQITRARITEFAADLLDSFTPTVTGAFNIFVGVLEIAGDALKNFESILSSWGVIDFFDSVYTKITMLGVGIAGLSAIIVNYRTGMNLLQMVQAGFTKSITATILGIEAENVAMLSSTQMLTMKITGYQAETIAARGSLTAIKSRILGLNELILKENGYKTALLTKLGYEKVAVTTTNAHWVAEQALSKGILMNTNYLTAQNLANVSSLKLIVAKIAGVEAEAIANVEAATTEQAVTVATVERLSATSALVPSILAEKAASDSAVVSNTAYAASLALAAAPAVALIAILVALATAFGSVYIAAQNAADQMKAFNEFVDDGDNLIKDAAQKTKNYAEQVQRLKRRQQGLNKTDAEAIQKQIDKSEAYRKMSENREKEIKSMVEHARSVKEQSDIAMDQATLEMNDKLKKSYEAVGASAGTTKNAIDSLWGEATDGANRYYEAAQNYIKNAEDLAAGTQTILDKMVGSGMDKDEALKRTKEYQESGQLILKYQLKMESSDDVFDKFHAWINLQYNELTHWWQEFWARWDSGDWSSAITGALLGFAHGWSKLPIVGDLTNWFKDTFANWGKNLNEEFEPVRQFWKGVEDFWNGLVDGFNDGLDSITDFFKPVTDFFNGGWKDLLLKGRDDVNSLNLQDMIRDMFDIDWSFLWDWLPDIDLGEMMSNWLGGAKQAGGGGIEWIKGLMNDYLITPVQEWINGFMADPLSYLGIELDTSLINTIIQSMTGTIDVFTEISNFFNDNFIIPITEWISGFMADPLSYLGNLVSDTSLLKIIFDSLGGEDPITFISEWVNSHIVQPLTTILQNFPQFISGLIDGLFNNTGNSENADNAGYKLGKSFGDGILRAIGEIPIVGDILRMLGLIPSTNPDANSKGKGVGDNVVMGYFKGTAKLVTDAVQEFTDIANGIAKKAHEAFAAAKGWAEQAWAGLNSIFQRHSPGFFYKSVKDEFEQMSNTINEQSSEAYSSAQTYGQSVYDGVVPFMEAMSNQIDQNMVTLDENINSEAIAQYKTDANTAEQIATSTVADSQMAFDGLGSNVGTVLSDMGGKLVSTYTGMNADQTSLLNNMKNNNTNAYKTMQTQTTSSLTNMRNSTQTVTNQMTSAWILMKNNIVTAANQLKTQSNSHFNQLSSTIGSFYRKLQNPANWGGSPNEITVSGRPSNISKGASAMRKIISQPTSRFAGGKAAGSPFPQTTTVSIKELLKMFGNDSNILSRKVNIGDLLGDDFLFGNWSDWYPKHYNQIKQTTGNWDMKGPALLNYIDTGMAFKVKEFENGTPNVSWTSFRQMAEALFTAIPYDFYYNHDKTGDWVSALYTGSVNCVDGNEALLALANTCGFSGHLEHGTWRGVAHVYAVINGQKMDATGWQQRRSWAGVAAGSPTKSSYAKLGGNEEVTNITIDLREATIYGVDDLERTIENAVQKGLQKEINVSTITGV